MIALDRGRLLGGDLRAAMFTAVLFLRHEHFAAIVSTNLGFQQPDALLDSLAVVWRRTVE